MYHIKAVVLHNIDRVAELIAEMFGADGRKQKTVITPEVGDLVVVQKFKLSVLQPAWETNAYKCAGYSINKTQIIVEDASGKCWCENKKCQEV